MGRGAETENRGNGEPVTRRQGEGETRGHGAQSAKGMAHSAKSIAQRAKREEQLAGELKGRTGDTERKEQGATSREQRAERNVEVRGLNNSTTQELERLNGPGNGAAGSWQRGEASSRVGGWPNRPAA